MGDFKGLTGQNITQWVLPAFIATALLTHEIRVVLMQTGSDEILSSKSDVHLFYLRRSEHFCFHKDYGYLIELVSDFVFLFVFAGFNVALK